MATIDPSSLFLVSGGGKGITAQCVVKLAERYGCRFVLLGRTSVDEPEPEWALGCDEESELKTRIIQHLRLNDKKPTPREVQTRLSNILSQREIRATLQAVEKAGGEAEYLSVDIIDATLLKKIVSKTIERLGPVSGLIHGAGNLADKRIEKKSAQDFETVFAAKIQGLENLLACVPPAQLDYLVLFSSAAGFYGNIGQSDYAMANEILNKTAYLIKRRHPRCRVLSLNWGPWDGGMVTPELKRIFAERNIQVIPTEGGTQALVDELETADTGTIQVLLGSGMAMLDRRPGSDLETCRIRRKLTLDANPFLQDHVVGGVAVLPTVCAISWISQVCEQRYPGFRFYRCQDFRVLKGIVFDQTLADEYVLELKEVEKSRADEITVETRIWSQGQTDKAFYHYSAQLLLRRRLPAPPTFDFDRTTRLNAVSDVAFYQDGTLFHGSTFQGIRRVLELGPEKVVLECTVDRIDERRQGQFQAHTFNPFAADIQFQSMVIWARHVHGAGSLPLACRAGEQFETVPFDKLFYVSMDVVDANEIRLVADIVTHDESGRVYNRVSGAEITISKRLNSLFLQNRLDAYLSEVSG